MFWALRDTENWLSFSTDKEDAGVVGVEGGFSVAPCTALHGTRLQATQELLDDTLLISHGTAMTRQAVRCRSLARFTKKRCTFQSAAKIDESAKLSWQRHRHGERGSRV
jgi:hypothetical protein